MTQGYDSLLAHEGADQPKYREVRYKDGALNLRLDKRGTTYRDLPGKYTDDLRFGMGNNIIVRTESGNMYAVGMGIFLNTDAKIYQDITNWNVFGEPTVGEPWSYGRGRITTRVTAIEMEYKLGANDGGEMQPGDNPFLKIDALLLACAEEIEAKQSGR
jgi:hypothetical protein